MQHNSNIQDLENFPYETLSDSSAEKNAVSFLRELRNVFVVPSYNSFVKWFSRSSLIEKFLLSYVLLNRESLVNEDEIEDLEKIIRQELEKRGVTFAERHMSMYSWPLVESTVQSEKNKPLLFAGSALPLGSLKKSRQAIMADGFFRGANVFIEGIWPVEFTTLLSYDLICYFIFPENRFGTRAWEILAGIAANQQTLTTYLNGNFWWFCSLFFTPIILGLGQTLRRRNWNNISEEEVDRICESFSSHQKSFFRDFLCWSSPLLQERRRLARAEALTMWQRHDRTKKLVPAMLQLARSSEGAAKLLSLSSLTEFAAALDENDLHHFASVGCDVDFLRDLREETLLVISRNANLSANGGSRILSLYANYCLWSIGSNRRNYSLDPLFGVASLYLIYTKLRLLMSILQFIYQKFDYFISKHNCQENRRFWTYVQQLAKHVCTICGDFKHINVNDIYEGQSCLNGILAQVKDTDEILRIIERVDNELISEFNLSKQQWEKWESTFLHEICEKISASHGNTLRTVDFSGSGFANKMPLSEEQALIIADFFANVTQVENINFSGRMIGDERAAQMLAQMRVQNLTSLNISGNNISKATVAVLAEQLPKALYLSVLDLSHNSLNDESIPYLLEIFNHTNISELFLGYNNFSSFGLSQLISHLPLTLKKIDFSRLPVTQDNLCALGHYLQNANVTSLTLANSNIDGEEFNAFSSFLENNTFLEILDVSNNQITAVGVEKLSSVLPNTSLLEINLSGNALGDRGVATVGLGLCNSKLQRLFLAATYVGDNGIIQFSYCVAHSNLQCVSFAGNYISEFGLEFFANATLGSSVTEANFASNVLADNGIIRLSYFLSNPNFSMQSFDFSDNEITSIGMQYLTNALGHNSTITQLIMRNNLIDNLAFINFAQVLSNTRITTIDFSDCGLSDEAIENLAKNLPATFLQNVTLAGNEISSSGALTLAKQLISKIPHENDLGNSYISRDLKWALNASHPDTTLTHLDFSGNQIEISGARALCRVLPPARFTLKLTDNSINETQVDPENCWVSAASANASPFYENTGFFEFLGSILQEQIFSASFWFYAAGIASAFWQEMWNVIKQHLDKETASHLEDLAASAEGATAKLTGEMMLRHSFQGPALAHDVTLLCKESYVQAKAATSDEQQDLLQKTVDGVSHGLTNLAFAYGAMFFISAVTGSPLIGLLAFPVIGNSRGIVNEFSSHYKKFGLIRAVEAGFDELAFSVPGGQLIKRTLTASNQVNFH
jgi:Ran GTPase-activating protein (RanGAP) involved in mRNA processing and transport